MQNKHESHVQNQFGPRANAYVASSVHAGGADLDQISAAVAAIRPARAVDLGCGGGHVAYRLAEHAGRVSACDLSADMLTAVARTASERGLANIETVETAAEKLPFADAEFDMLGCRFSAHHWRDVEAGLREARRVLKPGATALFVDVVASVDPLYDSHLQVVETLRDTSHVRDYSVSEWTAMLERAGFQVEGVLRWRLQMEFASWIGRMATPPDLVAAIRKIQTTASAEVKAYFEIEPDGSFMLDMAMLTARAV
jgi:ubiquinone/menaquinone biosynthesis C-methylase UbiE